MASLRQTDRDALGLRDALVGEEEVISIASEIEALAKAPSAAALTLGAAISGGHFATVAVAPAERVRMQISLCEEEPCIVRVINEFGEPMRATAEPNAVDWIMEDTSDPATLLVDLRQTAKVAIRREDGSGLLLRRRDDGIGVSEIAPPAVPLQPLEPVRAPVGKWAAECRDAWLAGELEHLRACDGLDAAVAAGMYARLEMPSERPVVIVRQILAGVAQGTHPAREWARRLGPGTCETIADLALAATDRVATAVEGLGENMQPGEEWWVNSLRDCCHDRDDLECVRVVLAEAGRSERLLAAFDRLDRAGRRLIAAIPRVVRLSDERLYRARLVDPEAWWASLAEHPVLIIE